MAVMPTINKEWVVATSGVTPKQYTKMGMESMEPPLPINPRDTPINKANMYPKISS